MAFACFNKRKCNKNFKLAVPPNVFTFRRFLRPPLVSSAVISTGHTFPVASVRVNKTICSSVVLLPSTCASWSFLFFLISSSWAFNLVAKSCGIFGRCQSIKSKTNQAAKNVSKFETTALIEHFLELKVAGKDLCNKALSVYFQVDANHFLAANRHEVKAVWRNSIARTKINKEFSTSHEAKLSLQR